MMINILSFIKSLFKCSTEYEDHIDTEYTNPPDHTDTEHTNPPDHSEIELVKIFK